MVALLCTASLLLMGDALANGDDAKGVRWGKARPWYNTPMLSRAAGQRAPDLEAIPKQLRGLFDHQGHIADLTRPVSRSSRPLWQQPVARQAGGVTDAWSPLIDWLPGNDKFVHAALLPSGNIALIGFHAYTMTPTPLGQPLPAGVTPTSHAVPLEFPIGGPPQDGWSISDTLFCTAQALMSDGRLFTAGGTRTLQQVGTNTSYVLGLGSAAIFDGAAWTAVAQPMKGAGVLPEPVRWYPTVTRRASGRMLVTAGADLVAPWILKNLSAEEYDPATGAWDLVTPSGALPAEAYAYQYSHVFQLPKNSPEGDVLAIGDVAMPSFMNDQGVWTRTTALRPGSVPALGYLGSSMASSVMLPLRVNEGEWGYANGSVLVVGGQYLSYNQFKSSVFDVAQRAWTRDINLGVVRRFPAGVLLPDGRVLVLAGQNDDGLGGLGRAQYIDPQADFALTWGADEMPEVRGYHSVALLLPDGRVLYGGGRDNTNPERASFRYYYPTYMFEPRPVIQATAPVMGYGSYGWVTWEGATPPAEVVLVGLGAMTHSFDMNQRHIQLQITGTGVYNGNSYSIFATPPDRRVAPPGHYMLFILDENRVPSEAKIIQVQ